ncbi:MAG TPA: ATP-binding protein [Acidimicrobiales bacterium]
MTIESTLSLPADPKSVSTARRFVREALDRSDAMAFEEGAVLLVSELVTNAVLHARTGPDVTLRLNDDRLWIGVHDDNPVTPAPKRYGPNAATGRGLQLVEQVAASWGVDKDGSGKVVWFELDQDSVERYAEAQQVALLEGLAAIEVDLGGDEDAAGLGVKEPGTTPDGTATSGGAAGRSSLRLPVNV